MEIKHNVTMNNAFHFNRNIKYSYYHKEVDIESFNEQSAKPAWLRSDI